MSGSEYVNIGIVLISVSTLLFLGAVVIMFAVYKKRNK